jgi:hypothetical protein
MSRDPETGVSQLGLGRRGLELYLSLVFPLGDEWKLGFMGFTLRDASCQNIHIGNIIKTGSRKKLLKGERVIISRQKLGRVLLMKREKSTWS